MQSVRAGVVVSRCDNACPARVLVANETGTLRFLHRAEPVGATTTFAPVGWFRAGLPTW
jgi:hypothetical protein